MIIDHFGHNVNGLFNEFYYDHCGNNEKLLDLGEQFQQQLRKQCRVIKQESTNTPFTELHNILDKIIDVADNNKELINFVKLIKQYCQEFEQFQHQSICLIDPNPILYRVYQGVKNGFEFNLAEVPKIYANSIGLKSIFSNLLINAKKFKHPDRPLRIVIIATQSKEFVAVVLMDNGVGFDCDRTINGIPAKEYIFKSGKQIQRKNGGQGIGLSIVRSYMCAFGGKVMVHSIPEKGTSFCLYFRTSNPVYSRKS